MTQDDFILRLIEIRQEQARMMVDFFAATYTVLDNFPEYKILPAPGPVTVENIKRVGIQNLSSIWAIVVQPGHDIPSGWVENRQDYFQTVDFGNERGRLYRATNRFVAADARAYVESCAFMTDYISSLDYPPDQAYKKSALYWDGFLLNTRAADVKRISASFSNLAPEGSKEWLPPAIWNQASQDYIRVDGIGERTFYASNAAISVTSVQGVSSVRVYEPLMRRKPRIYGRSDRPAWRKIHDEAVMGKKFTKKRDELVAGNNENGYGNAATSDWKDKAWKKAKSIAIDAAKGAVKDGVKHILKNASQRATLKKTVNNRLKELIRPR